MSRRIGKRVLSFLMAAVIIGGSVVASAWEQQAPVQIKVSEHVFDSIKVWNEGCVLKAKVAFDAPESAYTSRAPIRNAYQFQVQLKFSKNVTMRSPRFLNRRPGRRAYTFSQDTSSAKCVAKKRLKLYDADIIGCRGKRCRVGEFDQ